MNEPTPTTPTETPKAKSKRKPSAPKEPRKPRVIDPVILQIQAEAKAKKEQYKLYLKSHTVLGRILEMLPKLSAADLAELKNTLVPVEPK